MTSQDKEFFTIYFDNENGRLTRIEERMLALESSNQEIRTEIIALAKEQTVTSSKVDMLERLLYGGLGLGFGIMTLVMTILTLWLNRKGDKQSVSKPESTSKSILTWESVKELILMMKRE